LREADISEAAGQIAEVEPGLSGLALPVRHHGQVVGSVNIVTPTAMPRADVLGHNLAALGKAVRRIEATIADEDLISDATR
jgi:DNA-binding IclR family transcriptional regulator